LQPLPRLPDSVGSLNRDSPELQNTRLIQHRKAEATAGTVEAKGEDRMSDKFERHRQPWRQDEIQKLHTLAGKGMSVRAIAKALTRSEESVKDRAKADRLKITKLR
jgi:hypothetical protein